MPRSLAPVLIAALFATACGQAAPPSDIYFGVSGPFTGDNAEYGQIWKKAIDLGVDEINAKGGIKGRKVQVLYEDSQSDPKQSVTVAEKFVNDAYVLQNGVMRVEGRAADLLQDDQVRRAYLGEAAPLTA